MIVTFSGSLQAQQALPQAPAGPSFDVEIKAPQEIQAYLQSHLELLRYRELNDLDASELERLMEAAERNTRDLLGTLGYFSPDIGLTLRQTAAQPSAASQAPQVVSISVVPGEPTRIGSVNLVFTGPLGTDSSAVAQRNAIRASWPLRPGMIFTQAGWDQAKTQAQLLLTGQRYPAGQIVDSRAEIDAQARSASLNVTLDSGPAYRMGPLQITGTERYDPALVARVARLDPGSDYDRARLQEAQQRLADSGYFDSVFVSLDTAGDVGAAPVLIQVREAKRQKLVLGIGASTDSGPRLSLEHTNHRIPLIDWRAVSKISLDRDTRSAGVELTAPPDQNNWRWVTSALLKNETSGSFDVISQRLRAGRMQEGDRIDRNYYLQYDRARTTGSAGVTVADSISANYAWTQRNFDSLPFPSSGYGLGVELGGGTTLGNNREPYFRTQARWLGVWSLASRQESYLPSSRSGRIAVRVEGGAVVARAGVTLPSTQLFLTGGDTTVRGYSFESIGTELTSGQTAAGRYLAVGSVEWQRPITSNDKLTDWEGVLFVDAGAVADKPSELKAKVGVGAGVRWKSPVGPLQIDLAYGLAVKRLRLHLNVGFTF
ncbi:MAG: BamA/TamA family outer membrane protein [Rhodoferax sp.]|nr:BamA/TamA family outer membrane protein [Rhodoferax sp.]